MGRVDLGGERTGVEPALRGQHGKTAHAAVAHPVVLGFAVAGELLTGAGTRVEQHLVALEDAVRVRARPVVQALTGVGRYRIRVAAVVDRVVQHRLALRIGLEDGDQLLRLDAIREHGDQAGKAPFTYVAHRLDDLARMQRRLATVELQVAVRTERVKRLVEHFGRVCPVPALGRAVDRAPGTGPVAEVALVEMKLPEFTVGRGEVLHWLMKRDRADVRIAVRVVETPVVRVVDELVTGDLLELQPRVLSHEAQHAAAVLLARARSAGEVLGVHPENAGNVDPLRFVVHAAVPAVRQERSGRFTQRVAQTLAPVRRGTHRRATVRATVDREVDARLGVVRSEDLVLDIVEAGRRTAGDVPPPLEELPVARLPDRPDRVLLSDRVQGERVVGVDPVGQPILLAREEVRPAIRRCLAEFGYELLQ